MESVTIRVISAPSEMLKENTLQAFLDLGGNMVYPPHYYLPESETKAGGLLSSECHGRETQR